MIRPGTGDPLDERLASGLGGDRDRHVEEIEQRRGYHLRRERRERREGRKDRKKSQRELEKVIYEPVASPQDLEVLEVKAAESRAEFFAHVGSWLGVSGFLAIVNGVTTGFQPLWCVIPMLGWGIGLASHAAWTLLAMPRALNAQRQLISRRARPETEMAETKDLGQEIAGIAKHVREQVRSLDPPNSELEAALERAEEESRQLLTTLARMTELAESGHVQHASSEHLDMLRLERERISTALVGFRTSLANIEVDLLLLSGAHTSGGAALRTLEDETMWLHASAVGAKRAIDEMTGASSAPKKRRWLWWT